MARANEWGFWRITTRELKSFVHIFHDIMLSFHTYDIFSRFNSKVGCERLRKYIVRSIGDTNDSTSQWKSQYVWNKKILRAILDPWDPWGLCTQPRLTWFVACFRCRRNISNMRLPFNFWLPYRSKTIVIWHIVTKRVVETCLASVTASEGVEQAQLSNRGW